MSITKNIYKNQQNIKFNNINSDQSSESLFYLIKIKKGYYYFCLTGQSPFTTRWAGLSINGLKIDKWVGT